MNEHSMALAAITVAFLGIGAVYGNPLLRRICAFLPVARNRERLVDLAQEIAHDSVEEMLVATPGGSTANLSNTGDRPAEYFSRIVHSPFGDW